MLQTNQNILVISTMYPTKQHTSFGIFVKNQVEQLRNQGFFVDVLAIKEPKMGKTKVIKKYSKWLMKAILVCLKKRNKYSVIHAHYVFPSGWIGLWFKRWFKAKLIVTAHGGDIDKMAHLHPWIFKQTKRILQQADEVIVVGEGLKQSILNQFDIPKRNIHVMNMGVNRSIFRPMPQQEAKTTLQLDREQKIILYVGNLIEAKGMIELVQAYDQLKTSDPNLALHLIGAKKDPSFYKKLTHRIDQQKIKHVTFHSAMSQKEIATWMAAADVFVLPSHMEGFGLAALEAMACHTPVVGTSVGGLRVLLDGGAGLAVSPKQKDQLAQGLKQALYNQSLRQKMIYHGDKKAQQNNQERLIQSLITIYRR
ncbi:Putative teichuronic acid biosynthesis glycosyltransferase TuaC [Paraliobacillus sp. PM-2]|uniref:glycosyltransferase n=1 Tax=Paraliobacillus sp. PM-2 TaxID=1462524 RepID=UPI00061BD2B8|nr:glycosyltransferase [Paraliobacillus sp. PM-2]CQR46191.1 Putative teichuronic acid biosynthesis glycosyltransferase TuaC [Paraliobacillus sp. PM-2]